MITTFFAAAAAFIATNIDDLFINMLLFSAATDEKQTAQIVLGKFMGTGFLLVISAAAAFGFGTIAGDWLWVLGFVPVGLGVKEFISLTKGNAEEQNMVTVTGAAGTAAITLASGADNIGVYIPLLAGFGLWQVAVTALVFFTLTGLFCYTGKKLTEMPALEKFMEKYRSVLTPVIYIILGLYIIFC